MKRGGAAIAGVFAGAFVAGFFVRVIYAARDAVRSLDRQDAAITRRLNRDELMDQIRRAMEVL